MQLLRIDRLLTVYLFRFLRNLNQEIRLHIPILMYHSISDEVETCHPYFWINTTPRRFTEHMRYLYENKYSVISLSDAINLLSTNPQISQSTNQSTSQRKFVVLTFDDGYRDFYTTAFSILSRYGFTATVFLPTGFINEEGKPGLKGKRHLTWEQVKSLQKEGITFGSHTLNHPQLRGLSRQRAEYEIKRSKEIMEKKLATQIDLFCYPYSFPSHDREFTSFLKILLQSNGYVACVTTQIGCANDSNEHFFLPRLPVNSGDDTVFLKAKMQGGYNWLSNIQHLNKIKTGFRLGQILSARNS